MIRWTPVSTDARRDEGLTTYLSINARVIAQRDVAVREDRVFSMWAELGAQQLREVKERATGFG